MSGKNRIFAAAVTTAALVVLGAPVASAATFGGSPTGFNGDSILDLSGNQVPVNACQNQIPIQGAGAQVPLQTITALLNLGSSDNNTTSNNSESCGNTSTETDPTSITTAPTSDPNMPSWSDPSGSGSNGPAGFNGDSILKVANNEVPVNACQNQIPLQLIGAQVPASGLLGAINALGGGNNSTLTNSNACANDTTQSNGETINS
jgi:hypothetical protein